MDLLIAILMCLNLYASPDLLNDADFVGNNEATINQANRIIENQWYHYTEGGVVIDDGVGT